MRQAPFVRAQDRNHQKRQEKQSDIGLEITGTNGVGVDGGEIPEILDFPVYAVVIDRLGAMHGDRWGGCLRHGLRLGNPPRPVKRRAPPGRARERRLRVGRDQRSRAYRRGR